MSDIDSFIFASRQSAAVCLILTLAGIFLMMLAVEKAIIDTLPLFLGYGIGALWIFYKFRE